MVALFFWCFGKTIA